MILLFRHTHRNEKQVPVLGKERSFGFNPFPKFILVSLAILTIALALRPFVEFDENGEPRLTTWRQQKLEQELENLDGAEQYVLLAEKNGPYPCYSCPDSTTIFLYIGEVWKYGMTTKGEKGRYGNHMGLIGLQYVIQFEGTIEECLKEERRKIYHYALLPENHKRQKPLIRPPGNKKDS